MGIGINHPFRLESFGRNGIHRTEATGFTPEPEEEKVVYKEQWQMDLSLIKWSLSQKAAPM